MRGSTREAVTEEAKGVEAKEGLAAGKQEGRWEAEVGEAMAEGRTAAELAAEAVEVAEVDAEVARETVC